MPLSVAELRARLAASKAGAPNAVHSKGTGESKPADSGTPAAASSPRSETQGQTQQPAVSASGGTAGTSEQSSVPSGHLGSESASVPATVQSGTVVVAAEIQSTTLVVVERPDSTISEDAEARNELRNGDTNLDRTNPIHFGFLQRLADLERALLDRDPLMKTHLAAIHKTAIENEEIVALLTTEEIAKIMAAQQVHTNTVLVKETVKAGKKAAAAKVAKISIDDI